jgi:GNAT superfamily N-acetyltransferase
VQIVAARSAEHWSHAARLVFAYLRETAIDLGLDPPGTTGEVWEPVRHEALDPAAAFDTYFLAYRGIEPVGGTGVVTHDEVSVRMTRCYVAPDARRQGVAAAFVAAVVRHAERLDAERVVSDVLPSRTGAIAAWRSLGFIDAEPWGDGDAVYLERRLG